MRVTRGWILWLITFGLAALVLICVLRFPRPNQPVDRLILPLPPQQSLSWTAPKTKLPELGVSAITELFNGGMADPRGCEYREIEVVAGTCWGTAGTTKTHGWVIPSQGKAQFGICWNGLVYPLLSIGEKADLKSDVEELLKKDQEKLGASALSTTLSEKQRATQAKLKGEAFRPVQWPARWNTRFESEPVCVAYSTILPIKAAMLLRVGETDLAERVWFQWYGVPLQREDQDPYLTLATAWAWSLFDRAVCAHMRGDDSLALNSALALIPVQKTIEASAAQRNIPRPRNDETSDKPAPYLRFLEQLPDLIADQQRRQSEAKYTPVLASPRSVKGKDRVIGLIRDLELVSARQWGQPGGVSLGEDPIVHALVESGNEAVEPLLDCLEKDQRLTRSVRFWRDFSSHRTVLGVHEAAYAALAGILHADFFDIRSTSDSLTAHGAQGRKEVADRIRVYWNQYKNLTLQERWYNILNDDSAKPEQWIEASSNIVEDASTSRTYGSMGGWELNYSSDKPDGLRPLNGESLRSKTNPSVSELFVKRMHAANLPSDITLDLKKRLAKALAKWDGKNHFADLREITEEFKKLSSTDKEERKALAEAILDLYKERIEAGDSAAVPEYAAWLVEASRGGLDFARWAYLEILWKHMDDVAVQSATQSLLTDKDGKGRTLFDQRHGLANRLINTPLIGLPAFREKVYEGLSNKAEAGSVAIDKNSINVRTSDGSGGSYASMTSEDLFAPPIGKEVHIRYCDFYASEISELPGAPKFQLYWPEKKRDEAIIECIRHLQQYGDLYRYQSDTDSQSNSSKAVIHFPKLSAPATADDVKNHRAIFTLDGERRIWQVPEFPMGALWTTLKENPRMGWTISESNTSKEVITYETEGKVFQVEEILINGKWERFFGFVGPHSMAKVPASEIEFYPAQWMSRLSHGFEARVIINGKPDRAFRRFFDVFPTDATLSFAIRVRNHSGLDQELLGDAVQARENSKSLPQAVRLNLEYSPNMNIRLETLQSVVWKPVSLKKSISVSSSHASNISLPPTQDAEIMRGDLRDYFDLSKPGSYRIQAIFNAPNEVEGKTEFLVFTLSQNNP